MQINPIGNQPSFKAKFIQNQAITQAFRAELDDARAEHLELSLKNLSGHHKNVALLYSSTDNTITNLYNNKQVEISGKLTAYDIDDLSDIHSAKYKTLFSLSTTLAPQSIQFPVINSAPVGT